MNAILFLTLLSIQQDPNPTFTVGTATAARGQTAYGQIIVPAGVDSGLKIPVAVIHGAKQGKVVAFVAGSHGTEYASIVAMQRLIPRIPAVRLSGTVIVVPLINIASIEQMTPHLNPIDKKSMNGNYPGDSTGTQTQRALFAVYRAMVNPADVVVDLHGGDLDEDLRPYSYWFRGGRASQDSAGRALALAFGLDHIIVVDVNPSAPNAGRSLSSRALVDGKTAFVAEAGRTGLVLDADVNKLISGSLNVLGALGMLDRKPVSMKKVTWIGFGSRVAADSGGMFYATVSRDAHVKKGQVVGRTTDYWGRSTGDIRAPVDGIVTFIRGVPSMWPRATLVNVEKVLTTVPPWAAPTP
jgi:predicted deacylase